MNIENQGRVPFPSTQRTVIILMLLRIRKSRNLIAHLSKGRLHRGWHVGPPRSSAGNFEVAISHTPP
jgi:hypothetical protein